MSAYQKINAMITDRLIERIEATQQLPWKKPWTSISLMPKNLITGKDYQGVNVFLLQMRGHASPYFLSMKQINTMDGKVRKGEKSCPVVFWKIVEPKEGEPHESSDYWEVANPLNCKRL